MKTKITFAAQSTPLAKLCNARGSGRKDLLVGIFDGEPISPAAAALDSLTDGLLKKRRKVNGFEPIALRVDALQTALNLPGLNNMIVFGLGKRNQLTVATLRRCLREAFKYCRDEVLCTDLLVVLPDLNGLDGMTQRDLARVVAEYAVLMDYELPHRKTRELDDDPFPTHLDTLTVLTDAASVAPLNEALLRGKLIGNAVNFARDLVNEPQDVMTPAKLAEHARRIARNSKGTIKCTVIGESGMRKLGMDTSLAVSKAAENPPRMIRLTYTPRGKRKHKEVIGLVGKGVTYDTGGTDLKDYDNMRDMKCDMAGAAAVLATMSCLSVIKPSVKVEAVIIACENLVGSHAFQQGQVYKSMSGLTVEIDHTDCEGRLTLIDALHFIQTKCRATKVIDLATLTGAVEDALGNLVSGIYGNDRKFTADFLDNARTAGELMHELPLPEEYREGNRGRMADLTNDGSGPGSIIAALFLSEFIKPGVQWIHADIAATAFRRNAEGVDPEGATGVTVRTLVETLSRYC